MSLPGVDPADPTPADRRHLVFGAGKGGGAFPDYRVVLLGNKTSAGSETVDVLGTQVLDDDDARTRMGPRSELYAMYRKFVEVDPNAFIDFIAVTESAGGFATVDFTFASGPANAVSTVKIHAHGVDFEVPVDIGNTASDIAAAVNTAIPNADDGQLQLTASVLGAVVSVTYIHKGPRGTLVIGTDANKGVRMSFSKPCGVSVTKGATTAGTTEDDGTAAFAQLANATHAFWVLPWHTTSAPTSTDNQIGEAIAGTNGIKAAALPSIGKEQVAVFALVGTQAQATTVATAAAINIEFAYIFRSESDDWSPAMLAAHHAAVMRSLVVSHPAMLGEEGSPGAVRYKSTTSTVYSVRDKFVKADRATAAEIKADLNNGVTPIAHDDFGRPYIPRIVTSKSVNLAGNKDYRSREGHITFCVFFTWAQWRVWIESNRQPVVSDNLKEGQKPIARVSTPAQFEEGLRTIVLDLATSSPVDNAYRGPILSPSPADIDEMVKSIACLKLTAGLTMEANLIAPEHFIKSDTTLREVGKGY